MTVKDYSLALCEICGIEPTYKVMLDSTLINSIDTKALLNSIREFDY